MGNLSMRAVGVALLVVAAAVLGSPSVHADPAPVIGASGEQLITNTSETNAWHYAPSWAKVLNQSASAAYVKTDSLKRVRLEAMAECHPGWSSNKAASKAVYRFRSSFTGVALIRPVGSIYGKLVTYGALVGNGGATAKVTFAVHDETDSADILPQLTVHTGTSPGMIERLTKGERLEDSTNGDSISGYQAIPVIRGHEYTAEVKLWAECWSEFAYTVRVDYSRHAPGMIGYVLVKGIQVYPQTAEASAHDDSSGRGDYGYTPE